MSDRPLSLWFRRDLRLGDQPMLSAAVALGRPLLPVFVLDPETEALGREGIACWAGDFYAVRPLTAMGVDLGQGVLRMSLVHYTSAAEVAQLVSALDRVL